MEEPRFSTGCRGYKARIAGTAGQGAAEVGGRREAPLQEAPRALELHEVRDVRERERLRARREGLPRPSEQEALHLEKHGERVENTTWSVRRHFLILYGGGGNGYVNSQNVNSQN